jgi:acyl-CoA synthetase (AMP-forming)/AMP-acid ligase II
MIRKVEVAVEARRSDDLLIIARTDARTSLGLDEAIARGKAYARAGADIVFVEAPESADEFRRIADEIDAYLLANIVPTGFSPEVPGAQLKEWGFDIAIYPTLGMGTATAAMQAGYGFLQRNGSTINLDVPFMTMAQLHELVGFEEVWEFEKRHGLHVLHAWGMTEMTPVGTVCTLKPRLKELPEAERFRIRATQGLPLPFVELRVVGDSGPVPADGKSMGELHVRGPWVAASYFQNPSEADKFTMDGWFRTGDIVTIDPEGYIRITDRTKDLIKSGGEWISSVDLENALMGHPAVKEAAVIGLPHPTWAERPVACVVLREGSKATEKELREYLEPMFAKFWLPDSFVFLPAIPRTAVGKFLKSALREQLKEHRFRDA